MSMMDIWVARHAAHAKDSDIPGFLLFLGIIIVIAILIAFIVITAENKLTEPSITKYTDEKVTGKEIRSYTSKGGFEHTSYIFGLENGTAQKMVLVDKATYDTVEKGDLFSYNITSRRLKKFF